MRIFAKNHEWLSWLPYCFWLLCSLLFRRCYYSTIVGVLVLRGVMLSSLLLFVVDVPNVAFVTALAGFPALAVMLAIAGVPVVAGVLLLMVFLLLLASLLFLASLLIMAFLF